MEATKAKLSALWIFLMFNYLYCDLLGVMDAAILKQFLAGNVNGIDVTQSFLMGASLLMEIPITMIVVSRFLEYRANRRSNIVAASFMLLVQCATLLMGTSTLYYLFFSVIEIACTTFIVWFAWKWREELKHNF